MFKTYKYLKDYKKEVILGPIFKMTEAIFELIVPLVMAKIIDVGIKNMDLDYVVRMGIILVVLAVVGLLSTLVCQYFACVASVGFTSKLRSGLFKHINSLSYDTLDNTTPQTIINRMTNDINQMQLSVAMLIRLVIRAPFLVIGATIMATLISPIMAVVFLVSSISIALILYFVMSKSIPHIKKTNKGLDNIALLTKENLSGVRVIRAFSRQEDEITRFNSANEELLTTSKKAYNIQSLLNPLTYVVVNIGIVVILYLGSINVSIGKLTQGEVIALINYMMQILLALIVVANLIIIFTRASASDARINELFELKSNPLPTNNQDIKTDKFIVFDNVSFGYGSDDLTLSNISFSIDYNQTIGIIGQTGSGKTTLINLLMGFYKPTEGNIYIKGININNLSREQIIQMISLVPQKAVLFRGTILENLRFRKKDATIEEVNKALEIAQASFVTSLDFSVAANGKNLSGGQNQRLNIARSLVGDSDCIILDDSSSALDYQTELNLRRAINNEVKKAVILISQRISSIRHAKLIIVLDDGKMVGIGTHEELIQNCSTYQNIEQTQRG